MIRLNDNFQNLKESYLFSEIAKITNDFKFRNPNAEIIRMDIGDVRGPLSTEIIEALYEAVKDLSYEKSFKGYGPEQGYLFLREAISKTDYSSIKCKITEDDIFISDGAKCDLGNLGDLFSRDISIAVMNPSYPAYVDDAIINGFAYIDNKGKISKLIFLDCKPENDFLPEIPSFPIDIIYLCFPNNPTGSGINRNELKKWVDYAIENRSLIIYDSAYEAFVREKDIVKTIYEIERADEVAIEVRSFSKTGGFTGLRCGYTVVPEKLRGCYSDGSTESLNKLWKRRQTTKFNGASYLSQCAALALYTTEGQKNIRFKTDEYLSNTILIKKTLEKFGLDCYGGENSPYIWGGNKNEYNSHDLFKMFLERFYISVTPGSGFGSLGEGFVRLTGFNSRENTEKAMNRISSLL